MSRFMLALLLALLLASCQALATPVFLIRQCFHEPFPASFVYTCSNIWQDVDLVSPVQRRILPVAGELDKPSELGKSSLETPSILHNWTHAPICTQRLPEIDSELCIYTNDKFQSGRGLSVLSTPRIASNLETHPVFQGSPVPPLSPWQRSGWRVEQIPGKGLGVLAIRPLERGDLLMSYSPVLVVNPQAEQLLSVAEREFFLRTAVDQLPSATRDRFLAAATSFDDPRIQIQDIIHTNSFQLFLAGQMHIVVVSEPARLNHACNPNTIYYLNERDLTHYVHVVRPIAAGEEITTAYSDINVPSAQRKANLKASFHFDCSCPRCTGQGKFEDSDVRLERIVALTARLGEWPPPGSRRTYSDALGPPTPEMADELIELYRTEEMDSHIANPYGLAALAASAVKDAHRALDYVKLALEALRYKEGSTGGLDGPALVELEETLSTGREPLHWSWGARLNG